MPFLDEAAVHDLGKGLNFSDKREKARVGAASEFARAGICMPVTAHGACNIPVLAECAGSAIRELDQRRLRKQASCYVSRGDYAANAGDKQKLPNGVEAGRQGPSTQAITIWFSSNPCENPKDSHYATGVVYQRSSIGVRDVKDGTGKTYAVGEKFLNVDLYGTGSDPADNEWLFIGYVNDTNRSANDMGNHTANCAGRLLAKHVQRRNVWQPVP